MNIEFQKWWEQYNVSKIGHYEINEKDVYDAWNECKKHCLEILKKNKTTYRVEDGDIGSKLLFDYIDVKTIKEIEKL